MAKLRQWEHAAAVVCAFSLFIALVAGSALRPHYNAAVLPEPVGWTHPTHEVQSNVTQAASGLRFAVSPRTAPITRKPFRNVWMTRDLPSNWIPLSPQRDWSELPDSFSAADFQPPGTERASPVANSANRHTPFLLCIIRC